MRTALLPASISRSLCWASALIFLIAVADVDAQERPGHGVIESRIDQFVTSQDAASGFGGLVPAEESAARLSESDRVFLIEAHQMELLQVHTAAVALKRSTTQAVRSHARRVLEAHRASLVAIEKIARNHGQELERRFAPDFEQKADALQQAPDSSFGPVFFGQMLELHARTVALYEQTSSTTENADLLSLMEDSLPTLRTQLADAEQFSTTLGTVATH